MKKFNANEKYVLHEIADEAILFKVENEYTDSNSAIIFNETGAFMWKCLSNRCCTIEYLVDVLSSKFAVDPAETKADVEAFINKCMQEGLVFETTEG